MDLENAVWMLTALAAVVVLLTRMRLSSEQSQSGHAVVPLWIVNAHTVVGVVALVVWIVYLADPSGGVGAAALVAWWVEVVIGLLILARWMSGAGKHAADTTGDRLGRRPGAVDPRPRRDAARDRLLHLGRAGRSADLRVHPWSDAPAARGLYGGAVTRQDRQPWRLGPRGEKWFDIGLTLLLLLPVPAYLIWVAVPDGLLMLVQIAPLAWRRRHPVAVFVAVSAASAVQPFLNDYPLWSQLAFPIATYSVARFSTTAWSLGALAVGMLGAGVAAGDWVKRIYSDEGRAQDVTAYFITIALFVVVAWALGTLGRTRQAYVDALVERGERLQREAAQQAALAAIEERHRIAREMHDVVAHSLTTMVVQADGARAAGTHDPSVTAPALGTIAATGREALAESARDAGGAPLRGRRPAGAAAAALGPGEPAGRGPCRRDGGHRRVRPGPR
ncbi:hypothetical protein G5V59_14930 [Nocardioides sp. W3-2-3]|uniref:sensor histidine kinase n=1 Tax=Nocardioides convexus TaxID=2712224 RepID=UPI002418A676|nr:histidine kinase [Nocardioides convexus]NHA00802.1 hypothetical protein [Nocardioides convexus]